MIRFGDNILRCAAIAGRTAFESPLTMPIRHSGSTNPPVPARNVCAYTPGRSAGVPE